MFEAFHHFGPTSNRRGTCKGPDWDVHSENMGDQAGCCLQACFRRQSTSNVYTCWDIETSHKCPMLPTFEIATLLSGQCLVNRFDTVCTCGTSTVFWSFPALADQSEACSDQPWNMMTVGKAHAEAIQKLTMGFFSVKGRSMINHWCASYARKVLQLLHVDKRVDVEITR